MKAKREVWNYDSGERVWIGRYKNSHNLPHWHDDCELIYVESGSVEVFCEGDTHLLTKGQGMFICGGQVHYMVAKKDGVVLTTIVFHYELIKRFFKGIRLSTPVLENNYPIIDSYLSIKKEYREKKNFYKELAENEVIRLMLQIFRGEKLVNKPQNRDAREQFKKLLEHIGDNYEFFNLTDAAIFMNMNTSYFSRFFHANAGISFNKYLNYIKVENAVAMLKEGTYSVTEIAVSCGFGTIRNFNRIFKELTGYTPTMMPNGFYFSGEFINKASTFEDPTLSDCELLESSDSM